MVVSLSHRQGSGYEKQLLANPRPVTCHQSPEIRAYHVEKQLRQQEKELRNHNLVMGPIQAFHEYYDSKNYQTDQDPRKY